MTRTMPFMFALAAGFILAGCGQQQAQLSFAKDISPLIKKNCSECHLPPDGDGYKKSAFSVESYETLMKGTKFGPVIVAGDAASSSLYRMVSGQVDKSIQMPHGKTSLPADQVALIGRWIDQGAKNN